MIGADANLYRSARGVLATDGGIAVADDLVLTSVDKTVANGTYTVPRRPATTITLGAGGGLRGLGVAPAISMSGTLAPTSLLMFNLSSVVTPSATTEHASGRGVQEQPAHQRAARRRRRRHRARPSRASSTSCGCSRSPAAPARSRACSASTCRRTINSVGAGWTVAELLARCAIEAPGGDGHDHAADRRSTSATSRAGRANNYSLRSFGNAVHMRHSGGVSLGAQATPDTLLHLRGNASVHGSLTVEAESTEPAGARGRAQARLYVKDGKLVLQWNDGGPSLYTTIPLDSAGPYPARLVTTDTVAP